MVTRKKLLYIVRSLAVVTWVAQVIFLRSTLTGLLAFIPWAELPAQQQPRLVHRWEVEPDLGASWIPVIPKPVVTLELARFSSAERQIRLAEAQKAIRYSREPTLIGREEGLKSILSQLKTTDENLQVQLSLVSAAIKLADSSHAALLWERLRNDNPSRKLIEPALVKWKSPVALDVWRARLSQTDTPNSELIVAIEGIVTLGTEQDLTALETLLRSDRMNTPLKIIIARAMSSLTTRGLENLAEQVTASAIDQHELIVAELLSQHTSQRARDQLAEVLASDNDTARNVAYAAISDNFVALARALAAEMLMQSDNNLRQKAVEVFNRFDDVDSLRQQAIAISDRNRTIRNIVRENLEKKAQNAGLKPIVDEVITLQLDGASPPATVQAILLLVALEERERCEQLVELLQHTDMDTSMTAAWALQALVESPEILHLVLKETERLTQRLKQQEEVSLPEIFRQAYLFEAFGRNRYQPALESLKIYVPKNGHKMGDFTRASAIWALGKINEGSQDAALAKQLAKRMLDMSEDDPEDPLVQFACAVALGWIKAPASVGELKKVIGAPPEPIALARDWSLEQLSFTGE